MSETFFISDTHFGHHGFKKFVPWIKHMSHEEYIEQAVARWNSVVKKGDTVWVLGDVAKNTQGLIVYDRLNGHKNLVRGNHDVQSPLAYLKFFNTIHGIIKKYGFWISHCPIHPDELRGFKNVHGHVHQNELKDDRYIYVGSDKLEGYPISLEEIKRIGERR
jgi:calcineurin-like phosphoesterase family protein